jgi:ribosomal protein S6--L-glutamate ligase
MKIAILSNGNANYSTKRLVEEAEKRGHKVDVIKYKNCYISIEPHRNQVYYKGKALEHYDAIIPRISANMTKYGTAIVRQLEMQGEYVLSKSIAITRARDKLRSMQVLAKYGVDIPKTVVSRNTTDIDDLLEQLGEMPVIIKLANGTHGNGVILAETKKSAKSTMQAFYLTNDNGTNILLKEFIKE